MLGLFGRMIERAEGPWALAGTYAAAGAATNVAACYLLPRKACIESVGTTGAVLGAFLLASFFGGQKWSRARALEVACVVPFVVWESCRQHVSLAPFLTLGGAQLGAAVPLLLGSAAGALAAAGALRVVKALQKEAAKRRQPQASADGELSGLFDSLVKRIL